jgi:murein DD-endopeptidase MepM/ murein hydrolase activator NlpD
MRELRLTRVALALLSLIAAVALLAPASSNASSANVAALQVALKSLHLYKGKVDGVSGPLTRRGVMALQRKRGLRADGVPGPRTKRALGWRGRPPLGSRVIRPGFRGWDVAAVQFLLQAGGYGVGRADGIYGRMTRRAVKRAQRQAGLRPDGLVGPKTIRFLKRQNPSRGKPASGGSGTVLIDNPDENPIAFMRPVEGGWISGVFSENRKTHLHSGVDFAVPRGTPIKASASGVVIFAGWNSGGYGNLVVVQHKGGYTTWYAHMSKVTTRVDAEVKVGEQLGLVGSTGNSTGPHLHFEIRHFDTPLNPLPLLSPEATAARSYSAEVGGGEAQLPEAQVHGDAHEHATACSPVDADGAAGESWIAQASLCP